MEEPTVLLLRHLKSDDTLRFGQWLYNLIYEGFEPKPEGFIDTQVAVADMLYNIHDDELIKLIKEADNGRKNSR